MEEPEMTERQPRWIDIAPALMDLLEDRNAPEQTKVFVRNEIMRMAQVTDASVTRMQELEGVPIPNSAFLEAEKEALGHNDGPQNQPDEEEWEEAFRLRHGYPEDDPIGDCEGEARMEREAERAWAIERERAAEYYDYGDFY